jgi:hypothetical protein
MGNKARNESYQGTNGIGAEDVNFLCLRADVGIIIFAGTGNLLWCLCLLVDAVVVSLLARGRQVGTSNG